MCTWISTPPKPGPKGTTLLRKIARRPHFRRIAVGDSLLVAYIDPPDSQVENWVASPALFLMTNRSHLYALPPVAGTGLKFGGAPILKEVDPAQKSTVDEADLVKTLESFRPFLRGAEDYGVIRGADGLYADPMDKRFVVLERGKSVVITGCGGRMFKFGALFGQVAARWVNGDVSGSAFARWAAGQ